MSTIGFVKKLNTKSGTGRNGKPYTLYSMKLADKDGTELPGWFQCGFEKPTCKEGDYVKLEATPNGNNFDVTKGSVQVSKNPPAAPAGTGSSSGGAAAKVKESDLFGTIGGYNTEDDVRRMTYSNARSAAIEVVKLLLDADAIGLPASKNKASASSRYDIITAAVDKLTVQYFFDAASGRKLESVADDEPVAQEEDIPDSQEFEDDIPFDAPEDDDGFE